MLLTKTRGVLASVVGLGLIACLGARPGVAHAEGVRQSAQLAEQVRRGKTLFGEGKHTQAIRSLITTLEEQPDDAWTPELFQEAVKAAFDAFLRLSDDERNAVLAEYEDDGTRARKRTPPMVGTMTKWLRQLVPATSLKSPGGRLTLAAWNFVQGHHARAIAYGLGVLHQSPDSPATEYAITALVGMQYYSCDISGAMRTIRVVAKIAPNNRATGWAVCRGALMLCAYGYADRAETLCRQVQGIAPGTVGSRVADEMLRLIGEIDAMDYEAAFETLWRLRDRAVPGPASHLLRTLSMGIDWPHVHKDLESQDRLEALKEAVEAASENDADPHRRACALLVLAHCHQKQGLRKQSAKLFKRVLEADQPDLEEYALLEMACDLVHVNRKAAIVAFERFRDKYDGSVGAAAHLPRLAKLYRRDRRYEDGLKLVEWLENRCRKGYTVVDVRGDRLTASKIGCLYGLGRDGEAEALAEPLLRRKGFHEPVESLTGESLGDLRALLDEMGRREDVARFDKERQRRAAIRREQRNAMSVRDSTPSVRAAPVRKR